MISNEKQIQLFRIMCDDSIKQAKNQNKHKKRIKYNYVMKYPVSLLRKSITLDEINF